MSKKIKIGDYVEIINAHELAVGNQGEVYKVIKTLGGTIVIDVCGVEQNISRENVRYSSKIKVEFIKDKTIVEFNGKKTVTCCKEKFDEEKGVAMALCKAFGITYNDITSAITEFKKNNDIAVGDIVIVKNAGACYTTYPEIFDNDELAKYKKFYLEHRLAKKDLAYEVCAIKKHRFLNRQLYVIMDYKNRIYLIGRDGIKKVED